MLETIIQSLLESLRSAFPVGTAYTHTAFSQAPMPPAIAHFLNQALAQQVEQAVEAFARQHPWMDFQHPRMKAATVRFAEALGRHATLPAEQWERALQEAVKRVTQHLVRPAHTLAEFLFEASDGPVTEALLHRRLDYFKAYPYLKGVLETSLERGLLAATTVPQRNTLLMQADQEATRNHTPDQWRTLLEPLFQVMRATPATEGRGVPVSLLQHFFRDKHLLDVARRLALVRQEGVEFLDEHHLERLLSLPVQEPTPAPETPPAPVESPPLAPPAPLPALEANRPLWQQFSHLDNPSTAAPPEPAIPVALPDPVPVFMVIEPPVATTPAIPLSPEPSPPPPPAPPPTGLPVEVVEERSASDPAPPARTPPPAEPDAVPLWMRFMRDRQPPPSPAAPDLRTLEQRVLGPSGTPHRDQFVRHLFAGSQRAYEQALHHLEAASDWPTASRIIAEEVFRQHRVNIYSDPAVTFTNAVERRFRT
jgi:hypothetical protein